MFQMGKMYLLRSPVDVLQHEDGLEQSFTCSSESELGAPVGQ